MPINVYYLDDEENLGEIFSDYFESEHVKVTTFSDVNAAIQASRTNPPDLFFLDYRLPGADGDEVALATPENIPKFVITGDLAIKPKYAFRQIIAKPYEFETVQSIIDEYLEKLRR